MYRVLVFALAAASSFTPVYVQDFCQSNTEPDCHSHEDTPSDGQSSLQSARWNMSSSDLIQDLDKFRVSCKKLMGKADSCPHKLIERKLRREITSLFYVFSAEALPIDEVDGNFVRNVKNCVFSKSIPTPLKGPLRLGAVSKVVM